MSKILIISIIHAVLFGLGGLILGQMVLGAGFSESASMKTLYDWCFGLWRIFDAPASYFTYYSVISKWLWLPVQLMTSFLWANICVLAWVMVAKRYKVSEK